MDIIYEILETERLAEEKLAEAEKKRAAMLENVRREQQRFESIAAEDNRSYADALAHENDSRLAEELKSLEQVRDREFSRLEAVFEENSSKWADEIFDRMIALC